ncbi:hypothetical protein [Clostridium isatidis]|uniref:hypothetical protein n=1 Tax=Clostridium isatidis TaxID=182773 RepID=UPI003AAB8764
MRLKIRKKIVASTLTAVCLGVIATSMTANAIAITNAGIKEYNGIFNDQAFAWTGADAVDFVSAEIEIGSSYGSTFIGYKESLTGWVQTDQLTYKSAQVRGLHWAGPASGGANAITYP